jgi:hypothetical protein
MAGRDERRKILGQLKARQVELSRKSVAATASVPAVAPQDRITIRETADGLGIHVPAVKHITVMLGIFVWLGGWTAGEWFALYQIFTGGFGPDTVFLIFWVSIWTLGGIFAWMTLLWQLFGSERLFITGGSVVQDWGFGPFRTKTVWAPGEATKFRKAEPTLRKGRLQTSKGIAYEAGGAMRNFGASLTADETKAVLAAIGRHMPGAVFESAAAKAG